MLTDSVGLDTSLEYTVSVYRPGPLHVRLKLNQGSCIVEKLEKDPFGNLSEIEQNGMVRIGDILLSVNDVTLSGLTIQDIQNAIAQQSSRDTPRHFRFRAQQPSPSSPRKSKSFSPMLPLRRVDIFHSVLKERLINEGKLRNLSANGIPDQAGVRGIIWRLLLRYLPLETDDWESVVELKRNNYQSLCCSYFRDDSASLYPAPLQSSENATNINAHDHPLSESSDSNWNNYLSDMFLMEEIEKDVIRTHPDISFFIDDCLAPTVKKNMQRILFVFAKQHPHIRYVQGMNDLCGTLYYVFASDESNSWRKHAEADTYHCFESLILENKDMFIKSQDQCETGIHGRIERFYELLRVHDSDLYILFRNQGIDPSFYGLRWLTTLLCREFNLPDTIRLWDALFADTDRADFLSYVCCTMVMEQHDSLIVGDFANNLQLLQSYPHIDIIELLQRAMSLRAEDRSRTQSFVWDSQDAESSKQSNEQDVSVEAASRFFASAVGGMRYPRFTSGKGLSLGVPFMSGSSPTLSNIFSNAEAGVRKLFSEKSSWNNSSHNSVSVTSSSSSSSSSTSRTTVPAAIVPSNIEGEITSPDNLQSDMVVPSSTMNMNTTEGDIK